MKHHYIAVTIYENGMYYAYVLKTSRRENLLDKLNNVRGMIGAHLCDTRKDAELTVNFWNSVYKEEGRCISPERAEVHQREAYTCSP